MLEMAAEASVTNMPPGMVYYNTLRRMLEGRKHAASPSCWNTILHNLSYRTVPGKHYTSCCIVLFLENNDTTRRPGLVIRAGCEKLSPDAEPGAGSFSSWVRLDIIYGAAILRSIGGLS